MAAVKDGAAIVAPKPLEHLDGCPEPEDRIEEYELLRPKDRQYMAVVRCRECGAQRSSPSGRFAQTEENR